MSAIKIAPRDTDRFPGLMAVNTDYIQYTHRTTSDDGQGGTQIDTEVVMADGSRFVVEGNSQPTDYYIQAK